MPREIQLTKGYVTVVDEEDFELLSQYRWRAKKARNGSVYALRDPWNGETKRQDLVAMHRTILNAPEGMLVDHIDGDGLNNRRSNLRLATASQNQQNRKQWPLNTSGYRGVSFDRKCNKWRAGIRQMGRTIHLGMFESAEAAARAYDTKACELFGEFAMPNFPNGGQPRRLRAND